MITDLLNKELVDVCFLPPPLLQRIVDYVDVAPKMGTVQGAAHLLEDVLVHPLPAANQGFLRIISQVSHSKVHFSRARSEKHYKQIRRYMHMKIFQ